MNGVELSLVNIGIFRVMSFSFPDDKLSILTTTSASGKTTISKVFYAYLTGMVDTDLLRVGAMRGEAILRFKDKKYILVIEKDNNVKLERVLDEKYFYADQLVFNEISPILMSIYSKMAIPIENIVNRLFPEPEELKVLGAKLLSVSQPVDLEKTISIYEKSIAGMRARLEELTAKLNEINEKLKEAEVVEKLKPLVEYLREKEKIEEIMAEIEKRKQEYSRVIAELQRFNSVELQERRKEIASRLDKINRRLYTYKKVADLLEEIAYKFEELEPYADVLVEGYAVLVDSVFLEPDTIREVKDNLRVSASELKKKVGELEADARELEEELSAIDSKIEKLIRLKREQKSLELLLSRLKEELDSVKGYARTVEDKVKKTLEDLNMTQEEALRLLATSDKSKLLFEKRRIEQEIDKLRMNIKNYEARIEALRREAEEARKKASEVEEIKREYEKLKSEWTKKKKSFVSSFMEEFVKVFELAPVRDYDPKKATPFRPPHTYSQSERFLVAFAYMYALAKTLIKFGYPVPLVVVDMFVPVDKIYERAIITKLSELKGVTRIILKTGDKSYQVEVVA